MKTNSHGRNLNSNQCGFANNSLLQRSMICCIYSLPVMLTFNSSLQLIGGGEVFFIEYISSFLKGAWMFLLFLNILLMPLVKKIHLLFFESLYGIFLVIAYMSGNSENPYWQEFVLWPLAVSIPLGILFSCVNDKRFLYQKLIVVAWINSACASAGLLYAKFFNNESYNMPVAYYLMFSTLCILSSELMKNKWMNKIALLFNMSVILLCGSRGAFICMIIFMISYWATIASRKKLLRFIIGTTLLLIIIAIISSSLIEYYQQSNLHIRTLDLLLQKEVHWSGRDFIYQDCWNQINEKPILGQGIAGFKGEIYYPHSLFLEIWLTWGYFIGTMFCIITCAVFFNIFFVRRDCLLLIYGSFVLGQLLFSSSLFLSAYFFLCMYNTLFDQNRFQWFSDRSIKNTA